MKKQVRAKPRRERSFPRVFSKAFPAGFNNTVEKCFILNSDFRKLYRRYIKLFLKYKTLKEENKELRSVIESRILASDLKVVADIGFPKTAARIANEMERLKNA